MKNVTEYESSCDSELMLLELEKRKKSRKSWYYHDNAFGNFKPSYLFSNENLGFYYPLFHLKNKDILTVTGSGDQIIMGMLNDCKSIDTFDSNKITYYNLMLKLMAIKCLKYEEFIKFYSSNTNNKIEYLKYIKNIIGNNNFLSFYENILKYDDNAFSGCFLDNSIDIENIKRRITYLNKNEFIKLKNKDLSYDINFENIDLFDIPQKFKKKYDFINLSNILDYCNDYEKIKKLFFDLNENNLNQNGYILLKYCWSPISKSDLSYRLTKFPNTSIMKINDICLYDGKQEGNILVYQKK